MGGGGGGESCTLRAWGACAFSDGHGFFRPGSIASVRFLGEVLGLLVVGRIYDAVCWLSLKDGLRMWQGAVLRNSASEGPACGDSESLTWSHHSEEHLPVPETVEGAQVAPGDTLRRGGQPPPSGTRAPGVDPGLPCRTARLWVGGITPTLSQFPLRSGWKR